MGNNSKYYVKDGVNYPRVTSILGLLDKSGPLTYWAANCAVDYALERLDAIHAEHHVLPYEAIKEVMESARKNFRKVSKKALDVGSAVHEAIEVYLKTGKEPEKPSDQILSGFIAFLEWKDAHHLEVIKTEYSVYSDQPKYAGTLDLLAKLDGVTTLVDLKTSKAIYPEYRYQVAAYRACTETVERAGILRLDKETGKPEYQDITDTYQQDLKVFHKLCELYHALNPNI